MENEEFKLALSQIEESYRTALRCFVKYLQDDWKLEPNEKWPHAEPVPSDDFRSGYESAMRSLDGALDLFMDENLHQ